MVIVFHEEELIPLLEKSKNFGAWPEPGMNTINSLVYSPSIARFHHLSLSPK